MPRCRNDSSRRYKGNEPSPKGNGWCAHAEEIGTMRLGMDGQVWTVRSFVTKSSKSLVKRWVVSDFSKEFKKAENKMKAMLSKSIVSFTYLAANYETAKIEYDPKIDEWNIKENEIEFLVDHIGKHMGVMEMDRCGYESGYYTFIEWTGSDAGKRDKKLYRSSFFKINANFQTRPKYSKMSPKVKAQFLRELDRKALFAGLSPKLRTRIDKYLLDFMK